MEPVNSITLQFEGSTQIDFANTEITLMGPDPSGATDPDSGVPIEFEFPLTVENDGVSQMDPQFLKLGAARGRIPYPLNHEISPGMPQSVLLIIDSFWKYRCRVSVFSVVIGETEDRDEQRCRLCQRRQYTHRRAPP